MFFKLRSLLHQLVNVFLWTEKYTMFGTCDIYYKIYTWLMFTFLGWEIRMVGKLFADHKLESCYCIPGDASRIAGTWCGICHYCMIKWIYLWSRDTNWKLSFYYISYPTSLTNSLTNCSIPVIDSLISLQTLLIPC